MVCKATQSQTAAYRECSMFTSLHGLSGLWELPNLCSVFCTPRRPESGQNLASDNATLHSTVHLTKCDSVWPLCRSWRSI